MDIFFGDQTDEPSKRSKQTSKPKSYRCNEERRDSDSDWDGLDGNTKLSFFNSAFLLTVL